MINEHAHTSESAFATNVEYVEFEGGYIADRFFVKY